MTKKSIKNATKDNRIEVMMVIDNGKMNLKAICEDEELIYRNNIIKGVSQVGLLSENTHNVTFEMIDYTVGNSAYEKEMEEGKGSDEDMVTCFTAITKLLEKKELAEENVDIVLIYGESMNKYLNVGYKNFLTEKFLGEKKITRDGVEYKFNITECHILPEGIGILFEELLEEEEIKELYYITDIGGSTINYLTVSEFLPVEKECFSEEKGVHFLARRLTNFIRQRGEIINEDVIKKNLVAERSLGNEVLDELKKEFGLKYVAETIEKSWKSIGVNIKEMISYQPFYITGGGAGLFKEELEEYFKVGNKTVTIKPQSVWSNCRGFRNYGKYKLGKK